MVGHTHVARIDHDFDGVWMNPGHLKAARDRGQFPSFAVIETAADAVTIRIHELSGIVRMEKTISREKLVRE
jgi:predicted phosphodiesterase